MLLMELTSQRNVTKVTKMTFQMISLATGAVLVHFDLTRLKMTVSLKTDVRGVEMIKKAIAIAFVHNLHCDRNVISIMMKSIRCSWSKHMIQDLEERQNLQLTRFSIRAGGNPGWSNLSTMLERKLL